MGVTPKCLIQINQTSLLERQLRALHLLAPVQISLVTGYFHEQIEAAISNKNVEIIRNPEPARGQQHSVRLGLARMHADLDLIMIVLADQPLLGTDDFRELIAAFQKRAAHTQIMYPMVEAQRGNPVLMSVAVVQAFLNESCDVTCRQYIDTHRDKVYQYQTANDHFIVDLDTLEDLASLAKRTGYAVSKQVDISDKHIHSSAKDDAQ
jgi:CTP:molybdopterin cytidylyltransferase MocA